MRNNFSNPFNWESVNGKISFQGRSEKGVGQAAEENDSRWPLSNSWKGGFREVSRQKDEMLKKG
jgi:hypothetical protein